MKRLIPWILLAPFLVCDPDPNATSYLVNMDNAGWVETPAPLHYDLSGIANGSHTVEVKAKNVWGESPTVPFQFQKVLPSVTNIDLSEN